ncbi:MAG: hemolysin family protein, partial [Verrucomicrobiota bacterium]
PRPKVIWLNAADTHEQVWHKIVVSHHSYFPVYQGSRENPIGLVSVKAIYANLAAGAPVDLRSLAVKPLAVPATQNVLQLLETFKQAGRHVALVVDEFGSIVGLVTLNDVMEAVLGEFPTQDQRARPAVVARPDGTWLMDALVDLEAVEAALPGLRFDSTSRHEYQTLAGWVMKQFGRVPREGETFESAPYVFEILDMDRHRVDKVLVMKAGTVPDRPPGPRAPGAPPAAPGQGPSA